MMKPETLWQAENATEYLLFRCGLMNTREIAERLGMDVPAARRMLARMARDGRTEEWDGKGMGEAGAPSLWGLRNQPDPMDPEKRHKADLDGVPTQFFKLNCARLNDAAVYTPYNVLVTVVEIEPRKWRAYSSEWGLGKPGYANARTAAIGLAANVGAHIVPEAGSVELVDAQFGFEVDLAS